MSRIIKTAAALSRYLSLPPPSASALASTSYSALFNAPTSTSVSIPASPNISASVHTRSASTSSNSSSNPAGLTVSQRIRLKIESLNIPSRASLLSNRIHSLTGYDRIEHLKLSVTDTEAKLSRLRTDLSEKKSIYTEAAAQRLSSQTQVNDLLSRKASWNTHDVSVFTSLVAKDHLLETEAAAARISVQDAEDAVEREWDSLTKAILNRYHEEHVWAERMRSFSSTSQLVLFGGNLVVFLLAMLLVEPWKRRKMVAGFEEKVEQMKSELMLAVGSLSNGHTGSDILIANDIPTEQHNQFEIHWPTWKALSWESWHRFLSSLNSHLSQPMWTGFQLAYVVSICSIIAASAEFARAFKR